MGLQEGVKLKIFSADFGERSSVANISHSIKKKDAEEWTTDFSNGFCYLNYNAIDKAKQLNLPTREGFQKGKDKGISIIAIPDVVHNYNPTTKKTTTYFIIKDFFLTEEEYWDYKFEQYERYLKRSNEPAKYQKVATAQPSKEEDFVISADDEDLPF